MSPFPRPGGTLVASRDCGAVGDGYLAVSTGDSLTVLHIGCGESRGWFYARREGAQQEEGWLEVWNFIPAKPTKAHGKLTGAKEEPAAAQATTTVGATEPVPLPAAEQAVPTAGTDEQGPPIAAEQAAAPGTGAAGGTAVTVPRPTLAQARYAIAPYPANAGAGVQAGYLVPIAQGEELEVLWKGDEADVTYSRWAYARRMGPPHDEGWVLRDVIESSKSDGRGKDGPSRRARAGSCTPSALTPGEVAYHLRPGGLGSRLHANPGGGAAAAEGSTMLEHNEMVHVVEVSGSWVQVSTEGGASGWVRASYLRHAPVPAGPPPASSAAGSTATTPRRRVTFDAEEVVTVFP